MPPDLQERVLREVYETRLLVPWMHDPYFRDKRVARTCCFASEVAEQIKRWEANGNQELPPRLHKPFWDTLVRVTGGKP